MSHPPLREDTRDLLLAAGKRIFAQKGYDGATVKDIAREAGFNISLVSYYFGGKDGLYRTCLEIFGLSRLESAQRVLRAPNSIEEFTFRISQFSEEFIQCHLNEPEITTILHRECWMDNQVTRDIFEGTFIKVFETLVAFFESGKKRALLRSDLDPLVSAGLFFGSLIHLLRSDSISEAKFGLTLKDQKFRDHVLAQAIRNLTQGIFSKSGDPV